MKKMIMKNNFYKRKVNYYQSKILKKKKKIDKQTTYIFKISKEYLIDPNQLYGILLIEQVNRGGWIIKIIEMLFVKLFYNIVPKDISIGIAQVRISTAKFYLPNFKSREIANILLEDRINIRIAAKIIRTYYDTQKPKNNSGLIHLVNYYTTGDVYTPEDDSIKVYSLLLKWIIDCDLIRK